MDFCGRGWRRVWRVGRGGWRGWEQRVEGGREGWKREDAVLDAEESGRERKRVCDLIGYLIGFVWIWAVFVALDGAVEWAVGMDRVWRVWRVG